MSNDDRYRGSRDDQDFHSEDSRSHHYPEDNWQGNRGDNRQGKSGNHSGNNIQHGTGRRDDDHRYQRPDNYKNPPPAPRNRYADEPRHRHHDEHQPRFSRHSTGHNTGHNNNSHQSRSVTYPVEFHGKTSEYFKIWIVNIFLTIITFYIYSAWAKVRTKRYFYGNTTIDGSSFEYHAKGSQLLIGRMIAAVLLIIYIVGESISVAISLTALGLFVVFLPWAIWRSLRFNAKASSFRNIRFGFRGTSSPPYVNLFLIPLFLLVLLGATAYAVTTHYGVEISFDGLRALPEQAVENIIAGVLILILAVIIFVIPLLHKNLISYSHNSHRYGASNFSANIRGTRIYGIHFVTLLLSLVALMVIGGVISALVKFFVLSNDTLDRSDLLTRLEPFSEIISGAAIYLIAIPVIGIAAAYFKSAIRNHRYNATSIDARVQLHSHTGTLSLWALNFTNLLLLIFTLGFAYPYTKIRSARYFSSRTSITVDGGLNLFTENQRSKLRPMGEEMADAFDVQFDIGI